MSDALSADGPAHPLISTKLVVDGNFAPVTLREEFAAQKCCPVRFRIAMKSSIAELRCSRMSAFVDFQKLGLFDGRVGLGRG